MTFWCDGCHNLSPNDENFIYLIEELNEFIYEWTEITDKIDLARCHSLWVVEEYMFQEECMFILLDKLRG